MADLRALGRRFTAPARVLFAAVLPGVTLEAASPALIEKVRELHLCAPRAEPTRVCLRRVTSFVCFSGSRRSGARARERPQTV